MSTVVKTYYFREMTVAQHIQIRLRIMRRKHVLTGFREITSVQHIQSRLRIMKNEAPTLSGRAAPRSQKRTRNALRMPLKAVEENLEEQLVVPLEVEAVATPFSRHACGVQVTSW